MSQDVSLPCLYLFDQKILKISMQNRGSVNVKSFLFSYSLWQFLGNFDKITVIITNKLPLVQQRMELRLASALTIIFSGRW